MTTKQPSWEAIEAAIAALPANVRDGGKVLTVGIDIALDRVEFSVFSWSHDDEIAFETPCSASIAKAHGNGN